MFDSCLKKQQAMKNLFLACPSVETKYEKLIEMGRELRPLPSSFKTQDCLVQGCQSQMWLHTSGSKENLHFQAESDALISSGLAALLLSVYSGEPAEVILQCPPSYLEEIGINASLTPGRANGLYSLHLRMKQEALKSLC